MNTSSQQQSFKCLYIVSSFFVATLIISNIASSAKIVDLGITLFDKIPLAFDGGTLLFPLAYVLGDVLTEVYGFKTAKKVIWMGFAALVFTALFFFVLGRLPEETYWADETGGNDTFHAILGGMSYGGIVLASLAAYLVGELSNAKVLSIIKKKMQGRMLWVRTIGSSLVGQFLDTLIFMLIATAAGVFPWEIFLSLLVTNYIFKCSFEAIVTPLTYKACAYLKRQEGIDVFDE